MCAKLIDEDKLFMGCQAALHISTLMFFKTVFLVLGRSFCPCLFVVCWPSTDKTDYCNNMVNDFVYPPLCEDL